MADEKEYTPKQALAFLAHTLTTRLESTAETLKELRKRELTRDAAVLSKGELCLLCGNLDQPGHCTCVRALTKNSDAGYADNGLSNDSSGMAMSEKYPVGAPAKVRAPGSGGQMQKDAMDPAVIHANKQMAKFRSIASHPTAMPGGKLVNPKANPPEPKLTKDEYPTHEQGGATAVDKKNLASDKKAAGVGYVNSFLSRFQKPAAPAPEKLPGKAPLRGAAASMALASDKKAGGVGLINSIRTAGNPINDINWTGATGGMGTHVIVPPRRKTPQIITRTTSPKDRIGVGLGALARSEPSAESKSDYGTCALCKREEHPGPCM